MEGRKREGLCWPAHIEYFPVDFVKGFAAAQLNTQQHANEWRTSVIIYQTKNGGVLVIEGGVGWSGVWGGANVCHQTTI